MDLLVAKLQKANWAYHNTIHPIMTDAEYDRDLEKLRKEKRGLEAALAEKEGESSSSDRNLLTEVQYF